MSSVGAVDRAQFRLASTVLLLAALYFLAAQTLTLALSQLAGTDVSAVRWLARAAGMAAVVLVLWRWRWVRDPQRVALWLEERAPELQYALVTRVEPRHARHAVELDRVIASVPLVQRTRGSLGRSLVPAAIAAALGLAAVMAASRAAADGIRTLTPPARAGAVLLPQPLADLTVRIEPPRYSGQRTQVLREPDGIRALAGSRVTVEGSYPAADVEGRLGDVPLEVSGDNWRLGFTMPAAPRALRLRHSATGGERVLVVEPLEDAPPRVTLRLPVRDTLLRVPPASVTIAAEVSDDLGLATAVIEFMISSGQEETYTARRGQVDPRRFAGERSGRLSGTLRSDVLRMGPGDVLSIRAIARDRNDVTGPGIGVSDTRTIRVARSDEYDSVSVEAMAPMFGDSALLSQRMILQLTEALVREMPSLPQASIVARATALAFDQERLRDRVHSVVFPGHEHADESPMEGEPPDHAEPPDPVNVDLKIAYEAMWEAGRELRIASPATAVPPMRVAVDALDRARMANRVYLRGGVPRVVLDLDRVRLTGTERGVSAAREPRPPADTLLRSIAGRLMRLSSDTLRSPAARLNEVNEMRVVLLTASPRAAAALAAAAQSLRAGRSAREEIATAARELGGAAVVRERLLPWSGW